MNLIFFSINLFCKLIERNSSYIFIDKLEMILFSNDIISFITFEDSSSFDGILVFGR